MKQLIYCIANLQSVGENILSSYKYSMKREYVIITFMAYTHLPLLAIIHNIVPSCVAQIILIFGNNTCYLNLQEARFCHKEDPS